MAQVLRIANRQARRLWLASQGLAEAPTGARDLLSVIDDLGFVQLDTIQVVARAHDHILWSRSQTYRPKHLHRLYQNRQVFEHFTHDASILPMTLLPIWRRQFRRMQAKIDGSNWWSNMPGPEERAGFKARFATEGALSTQDFESDAPRNPKMWSRPLHKQALDYMWYSGELATCHRRGFNKVYDLGARVFRSHWTARELPDQDQVTALCWGALNRIAVGSLSEIRRFWDAVDVGEVKTWAEIAKPVPVQVQSHDGSWSEAFACADIEDRLDGPAPTARLRILNPFDPVVRDRARLERLFGMEYRNEMFVPKAKRKWGYYVFPLLEGDRFVGRLEAKAHRSKGVLEVLNFWPEPKVAWPQSRVAKLDAELDRLCRLADVKQVEWAASAQRP